MRRPGPPLTLDEVRLLPQAGISALDLEVWKAEEGSAGPSCEGLCNKDGCCCCLLPESRNEPRRASFTGS